MAMAGMLYCPESRPQAFRCRLPQDEELVVSRNCMHRPAFQRAAQRGMHGWRCDHSSTGDSMIPGALQLLGPPPKWQCANGLASNSEMWQP